MNVKLNNRIMPNERIRYVASLFNAGALTMALKLVHDIVSAVADATPL